MATRYLITILLFSQYCIAQNFGSNGAGWFENSTAQSEIWLKEITNGMVLRVPGGAIAKFPDPSTSNRGWGMTIEGVDSIFAAYSNSDETGDNSIETWHQKVNEQPLYSFIDELINFCAIFPETKVIWVANIYIPASRTVTIIQRLIDGGVNVVAIEMGNETYSQMKVPTPNGFNFDFELYKKKVTPVMTALKAAFDIPIVQISCDDNTSTQRNWNTQLAEWIPAEDWVCLHHYLNEGETQDVLTYDADFSYHFNLFSGHTFVMTETNTKPSSWKGDTWENAAYVFKFFNEHGKEFEYLCLHNGVSPAKFGIIYNVNQKPTRNTTYYTFDMLLNYSGDWFVHMGESYEAPNDAFYYYSTSLTSKDMTFGSGRTIPKYSFGYVKNCDELSFWFDADGDNYGEPAAPAHGCEVLPGYVLNDLDCNDFNASIHPGAPETCNTVDDDCDGDIDEGLTQYTSYEDKDGDNFGAGIPEFNCLIKPDYVTNNTDCNDNDVTIYPGATEPCGSIDYNCDKVTVVCPPVVCYKKVLGIFCIIDKPCKKNNCKK